MCTLGATPAARACSAWARPISPPSAVTAALFDMFCGLNGRTRRPRRRQARARPGDEQGLADARAGALQHDRPRGQNSMPSCAFTPAAKWCFTSVISVTRSAAAIRPGRALRPVTTTCRPGGRRRQAGQHRGFVEIVVAQRDVQFVQHQQAEAGALHHLHRALPGALGGGDVAGAVLRLPGEALAHRVPFDQVAEAGEGVALAGGPGALDELHHADRPAAPEHAQREAERRRGLALAGAGVDHQQALLDGLGRHLGVLHGLALGHLLAVARLVVGHFTTIGSPATMNTTRSARAATRWCSRPASSRNARASALSGTMPRPTSLETITVGARARVQRRQQRRPVGDGASASIRLVSHSVRQSTSTGSGASSAAGRSSGASTVRQPFVPAGAVLGDPRAHLVVERLRGRDVAPGGGQGGDQRLGMRALAGPRAAQHEGHGRGFDLTCHTSGHTRASDGPSMWKVKRERGATPRLPPQL